MRVLPLGWRVILTGIAGSSTGIADAHVRINSIPCKGIEKDLASSFATIASEDVSQGRDSSFTGIADAHVRIHSPSTKGILNLAFSKEEILLLRR